MNATAELPSQFGFRAGARGTHGSRSIMLEDLDRLMAATAPATTYDEYASRS